MEKSSEIFIVHVQTGALPEKIHTKWPSNKPAKQKLAWLIKLFELAEDELGNFVSLERVEEVWGQNLYFM